MTTIAERLAAAGIEVKPLEWTGYFGAFANTKWGGYSITETAGPDDNYDWFEWRHSSRADSDVSEESFRTKKEAKAAAQADFTARILAALQVRP